MRRQTELSSNYAAAHGLQLASTEKYHDIGVSAFKGDNSKTGALSRFVKAAEKGSIPSGSYLLVESFDRLSRQQISDALSLFLRIVQADITLVTLADGKVYKRNLDSLDLLYSIMSMSRAHEESEMKSRRLGASWNSKRSRAASGRITSLCPAWLAPRSSKGFEVIKHRAEIVKEIFHAAANGQGSFTIARSLNERGVPKFTSKGKAGWQPSYITKILTNRSVLGEFQPHKMVAGKRVPEGEAVPKYFPRIIEESLFYSAQAGRSDRKIRGAGRKGVRFTNLFSGLARCALCGGPIHFINKGNDELYFQCDRARRGLGCTKGSWRYQDFERSFLAFVKEVDLSSLYEKKSVTKTRRTLEADIAAFKGKLAEAEMQREETFSLVGSGPSRTFIQSKLDKLSESIVKTEALLKAKEADLAALSSQEQAFVSEKKTLSRFIGRLQDRNTSDLGAIRFAVAGRIKNLVKSIHLFPKLDDDVSATWRLFKLTKTADRTDPVAAAKLLAHSGFRDQRFLVEFQSGATRFVYPKPNQPDKVLFSAAWQVNPWAG